MWVRRAFNSEVREGLYERKMEMERKETDTSDMEVEKGEILEIVFNWYILFLGRYSKQQEIPSAQMLRTSVFR